MDGREMTEMLLLLEVVDGEAIAVMVVVVSYADAVAV